MISGRSLQCEERRELNEIETEETKQNQFLFAVSNDSQGVTTQKIKQNEQKIKLTYNLLSIIGKI